MASCRYYSVVYFLCFCLLVQNDIPCSTGEDSPCLNPSFEPDHKIEIEYFYNANNRVLEMNGICEIVRNSNGRISLIHKMGAEVTENANGELDCGKYTPCDEDRVLACWSIQDLKTFNSCGEVTQLLDQVGLAECVCDRKSDQILIDNGIARSDYQIPPGNIPTIVISEKYDPCFDTTNFETMKTFFCAAYHNNLPVCQK